MTPREIRSWLSSLSWRRGASWLREKTLRRASFEKVRKSFELGDLERSWIGLEWEWNVLILFWNFVSF